MDKTTFLTHLCSSNHIRNAKMGPSISVAIELHNPNIRAQSTVYFPIGGLVSVLSDYMETGHENKLNFNTVTAVISLIC